MVSDRQAALGPRVGIQQATLCQAYTMGLVGVCSECGCPRPSTLSRSVQIMNTKGLPEVVWWPGGQEGPGREGHAMLIVMGVRSLAS